MAADKDEKVAEQIRRTLENRSEINESNVTVLVVDDMATLRGRVGSPSERDQAEQIATGAGGVSQVRNLIEVDREGADADRQLCQHIQTALQKDGDLEKAGIRVAVNNGLALLSGQVPDTSQRYQAESVVRKQGVAAVRNEIQVAGL